MEPNMSQIIMNENKRKLVSPFALHKLFRYSRKQQTLVFGNNIKLRNYS